MSVTVTIEVETDRDGSTVSVTETYPFFSSDAGTTSQVIENLSKQAVSRAKATINADA